MLSQFVGTGFQVLFHSPPGVLFTFPSQYFSLSITREYLALRGGPRSFPQNSSCFVVLWISLPSASLRLRGFHPLRQAFPKPFCFVSLPYFAVLTPEYFYSGLGFPAFARRYLRDHFCFLFLRLLRCFSSAGLPLHTYGFTMQ